MRIISLTTMICTLLLVSACDFGQQQPTQEIPKVPVTASTPVTKDVTVYLESIGSLHPTISMEIRPQVTGKIEKTWVHEGQVVKEGTPLFQIDSIPYIIKVHAAEAQLAMDQASFQAIQKKLERFKGLAQKDLISQTEWDELETQLMKAQAALDLDEAQLNAAKLDCEYCTLRSPTSGRVGKLDVHPGLLVISGQNTPLVSIANMDPLIVEFTVTEKEFLQIPSLNVSFEMQPLCSATITRSGNITFLDNHFDTKNGLLLVRGKIPNPDYSLRPGQSVRIHVPTAVIPQAKLLPQKAIRYNQDGPYVYVVQPDNTVTLRQIVLGIEQGSDQVVQQGIEAHEQVIIDGHLRLSPGAKVDVKS